MTIEAREAHPLVILGFALLVGSLIAIAGVCVSAAGAPEIGVVDDWGRVDEAAGRIATWELVLVVVAATALATWVVRKPSWSPDGGRGVRTVLGIALAVAAVLAAAAVAGVLAVLERKFVGPATPTDLYSDTEKIGEIAVYIGILLAVAAVGYFAARELRAGRDQARLSAQRKAPSP